MNQFKDGASLIALRANAPVIPVYIEEKTNFFQRKKIIIGEPIDCQANQEKEVINLLKVQALTNIMKEKMDEFAYLIRESRVNKVKPIFASETKKGEKNETGLIF